MGFPFRGGRKPKHNPAGTSGSNQQSTPRPRQGRRSKRVKGLPTNSKRAKIIVTILHPAQWKWRDDSLYDVQPLDVDWVILPGDERSGYQNDYHSPVVEHKQLPRKEVLDDIRPSDVVREILPVDEHWSDCHPPVVEHKHQQPRKKAPNDVRPSDDDQGIPPVDEHRSDCHPPVIEHKRQPRKKVLDVDRPLDADQGRFSVDEQHQNDCHPTVVDQRIAGALDDVQPTDSNQERWVPGAVQLSDTTHVHQGEVESIVPSPGGKQDMLETGDMLEVEESVQSLDVNLGTLLVNEQHQNDCDPTVVMHKQQSRKITNDIQPLDITQERVNMHWEEPGSIIRCHDGRQEESEMKKEMLEVAETVDFVQERQPRKIDSKALNDLDLTDRERPLLGGLG